MDDPPPPPAFSIDVATSPQDLQDAAALFLEYAGGLGIDLAFQSFAGELAGLPGKYAPPHGVLLLARRRTGGDGGGADADAATPLGRPLGCVAVRPLPTEPAPAPPSLAPAPNARCELKRLYVRAEARGTGLGAALARRALDEAAARGYREVVMDTLASMAPARRLYAKLGFAETAAYYETPIAETVFYRRALP